MADPALLGTARLRRWMSGDPLTVTPPGGMNALLAAEMYESGDRRLGKPPYRRHHVRAAGTPAIHEIDGPAAWHRLRARAG